jgi:Stealth protein CR2, conserved region 2/Stealth protein CR3, conserved region 3/Stealth protein CR4, conserved region 4/Stealth protein CR1, conserved region 1
MTDEPSTTHTPELALVADARADRFNRTDVVFRKGAYRLSGAPFTPHDARADDLNVLAAALDDAAIDYLLVRGNNDRPVLAVDRARRADVAIALAGAFAGEPFYSALLDSDGELDEQHDPLLLADGALASDRAAAAFRIYRPRIAPSGKLRYGADDAPQLEFWRFTEDLITAPLENALMRHQLPRSEAVQDTVEAYDRAWPTLEHMWAPLASDVTFDIDMVFSWVDGTSLDFQRERAKRMKSYVVGDGDDSEARFRQIDELKYALRSVYTFAPWVRRIFIATDSPAPAWLADHPRVTIMRSEDFFPDTSGLPTHNSHAVESQLHHIPGLAEHFLYSNDDMFFGRPLRPDHFFSPGGVSKFVEAAIRIGLGENNPARSGYENAARVNRRLLHERFGAVTTRHLEHCAAPLRKSVMTELEKTFPDDFARTAASRFRSATDISVTNSLYHYYALMTGKAVKQENARVLYVETTLRSSPAQMDRLLKKRDRDMFCLNDGSQPEISVEKRTRTVTEFLERYLPFPAPWEKEWTGSAALTAGAAEVADAAVTTA